MGGRGGSCEHRLVGPTVLVVDDHADFRRSVRALLEADGYVVVGEAAGGGEVAEAVRRLRPRIVLLDITLPDLDGFAVADQLAATPDAPAVVLISSRDARAYGARLTAAPARGFIAKRELSGERLALVVGEPPEDRPGDVPQEAS
jgi:DNA-binding NarL/FixJ family response regulator